MKPPYFAVIFTSKLEQGVEGYEAMAEKMDTQVRLQPGFLGFDSVRDRERAGITVSYWNSLDAIRRWKAVAEHREAQVRGKNEWYSHYRIRIAQVTEEYGN